MKTFKMLSFHLLSDHEQQSIPLIDGIVINLENSHKMWTLEMLIDKQYYEQFQTLLSTEQVIDANVVISFPENDPAPFLLVVNNIQQMENEISVLFKGRLKAQRQQYAEHLLQQLLEEGLTGSELLQTFQQSMRVRPKLKM